MKRATQSVDHLPANTTSPLKLVPSGELSEKTRTRLSRLKCLIGDQVLLKLVAPERHLHGLWIPDSAKREAYELWQGVVIAVGPGDRSKTGQILPVGVKHGDRVMFYSVGGKTATRWPSAEHVILSESYIQCVIEP